MSGAADTPADIDDILDLAGRLADAARPGTLSATSKMRTPPSWHAAASLSPECDTAMHHTDPPCESVTLTGPSVCSDHSVMAPSSEPLKRFTRRRQHFDQVPCQVGKEPSWTFKSFRATGNIVDHEDIVRCEKMMLPSQTAGQRTAGDRRPTRMTAGSASLCICFWGSFGGPRIFWASFFSASHT